MSFDFRASQVRTNKLITSGSTGTPAKLLVYDISADGTPANQGNINDNVFASSSIGSDTFIFISGSRSSITGSEGGTVVFGGDVRVSGTLQAITETNVDDFYMPPHVLVHRNSGGIDSLDNGGIFCASVGNLALSFGGKPTTSGIEFSILNSQGGISYFPSASQIVIRNQSNGSIFLNSYGQWGGGGISIGQGLINEHQAHDSQVLIYADTAYVSMSAFDDVHIKAGDNESGTVKFYTFAIGDAVELTDINNTSITASLANRTIVGAINELKVSASFATGSGGGGGGDSLWTDQTAYIYNTSSFMASSPFGVFTSNGNSIDSSVRNGSIQSSRANTITSTAVMSSIIASSRSYVTASTNTAVIASRRTSIFSGSIAACAVLAADNSLFNDNNGFGIVNSSIFTSDGAKIFGGNTSTIISSINSTISQSDVSFILGSSDASIDMESYGLYNSIIGGFNSRITGDGGIAQLNMVYGPGIRSSGDCRMHIGFGGFATYATQPLIVISGSTHFKSGSGATFFNGLSGSLTRLSDGSSYLVAGSGVTITSASNGAVTISATGGGGSTLPTRLTVGNYSVVTQSNSQTVGGNYIVSSEHQSGSILMRSILSTSDALNTAHLRLFSITDGYYLPIGGAGVFELNTTSTTPTVLTSANLNTIITSSILVEVQVSGTIGGGSLAIVHHNSDLIFSS